MKHLATLAIALASSLGFAQITVPPFTVIRGEHRPNDVLYVRDSPGVVIEGCTYRAIVVHLCPGAVVRHNVIRQKPGQAYLVAGSAKKAYSHPVYGPEGILVWGSDRTIVEDNRILGQYGTGNTGTNDCIQIMPDPGDGTGNLPYDGWWRGRPESSALDNFTYYTTKSIDGRSVWFGHQPQRFIEGVVIRNNFISGSRLAGVFAYNVRRITIVGNEIGDVYDHAITVEQSVQAYVARNRGWCTEKHTPGALNGGIAVLFASIGAIVEENSFPGQHFRVYPNSHPNIDNVFRYNIAQGFACQPSYRKPEDGREPWVEGMKLIYNEFPEMFVKPGPFKPGIVGLPEDE